MKKQSVPVRASTNQINETKFKTDKQIHIFLINKVTPFIVLLLSRSSPSASFMKQIKTAHRLVDGEGFSTLLKTVGDS